MKKIIILCIMMVGTLLIAQNEQVEKEEKSIITLSQEKRMDLHANMFLEEYMLIYSETKTNKIYVNNLLFLKNSFPHNYSILGSKIYDSFYYANEKKIKNLSFKYKSKNGQLMIKEISSGLSNYFRAYLDEYWEHINELIHRVASICNDSLIRQQKIQDIYFKPLKLNKGKNE